MSAFAWASELGSKIFYFLGQLDEAKDETRTGLEAAESHRLEVVRPWLASALCDVLIERGRLEEAAVVIRSARSPDPAHERFALLVSHMQLGVDQARPEDALPALAELRRRFDRHPGGDVPSPLPWRSTGARAPAATGRDEEALGLARAEVDLARTWGAPRPLGRALRILGTLEGGAAGLASLRAAGRAAGGIWADPTRRSRRRCSWRYDRRDAPRERLPQARDPLPDRAFQGPRLERAHDLAAALGTWLFARGMLPMLGERRGR